MVEAKSAQRELAEHDTALTELLRRLRQGVAQEEPAALHWAVHLDDALSRRLLRKDCEDKLRLLYAHLYGLPRSKRLPHCPEGVVPEAGSAVALAAASRVAANMERLRISLAEALAQAETQRRPAAFFLLTCHLRKERPRSRGRACERFPWVSLATSLLALGLIVDCFDRRSAARFATVVHAFKEAPTSRWMPMSISSLEPLIGSWWLATWLVLAGLAARGDGNAKRAACLLGLGSCRSPPLSGRGSGAKGTGPIGRAVAVASLLAALPRCCAVGLPGVQGRARQFCKALGFGRQA